MIESGRGYSRQGFNVPVGLGLLKVPYRPAADWVEACAASGGKVSGVLAHLLSEASFTAVCESMLADQITNADLEKGTQELFKMALPYSWWTSFRLLLMSRQPKIMGRMILAGADPYRLPPAVWCAAVFTELTQGAKAEDVYMFEAQLFAPPPGVDDDVLGWDDEEDFDSMVAKARSMPGMK